jgi:diguanylate cyclase (GGDEF)-like protein
VLIAEGKLVVGTTPTNWAEDVNLITSIIGMTIAGALSLSLSQSRLAARHRREAETDALTGLLNRRALFERHGAGEMAEQTAVIVFDLDEFKTINDRHGHGIGDLVLRRFAAAIGDNLRPFDTAARMGGEEFALVLPRCTPELALLVAERIRALFETDQMETEEGPLRATVSAGLAFSEIAVPFESALRRADAALYRAKRDGRNRVVAFNMRLVA